MKEPEGRKASKEHTERPASIEGKVNESENELRAARRPPRPFWATKGQIQFLCLLIFYSALQVERASSSSYFSSFRLRSSCDSGLYLILLRDEPL